MNLHRHDSWRRNHLGTIDPIIRCIYAGISRVSTQVELRRYTFNGGSCIGTGTHTHISLVPTIPHTEFTIDSAQFRSICGSTARRIHAQKHPYHQNHHKKLADLMQDSREILRPKGSSSLTSSRQIHRNKLRSQGIFHHHDSYSMSKSWDYNDSPSGAKVRACTWVF
jgi:hypothetical protein